MNAKLLQRWRTSDPGNLGSLRRLERSLEANGWQLDGRSPRAWVDRLDVAVAEELELATAQVRRLGRAAVPALVDAVESHHRGGRDVLERCSRKIYLLGTLDPRPTCAVPVMVQLIEGPSARMRLEALRALADLRPRPSRAVVTAVLDAYESRHGSIALRAVAARTLAHVDGALPDDVRRAALARLTDDHPAVRTATYQLLTRWPAPDAELRDALDEMATIDDVAPVAALAALAHFDGEAARDRLLDATVAGGPYDDRIRIPAATALASLGDAAEPVLRKLVDWQPSRPWAATAFRIVVDAIAAARAGHRASLTTPIAAVAVACRTPRPPSDLPPFDSPTWSFARRMARLATTGPECALRLAIAAVREVFPIWLIEQPQEAELLAIVHLLEDHVLAPVASLEPAARRLNSVYVHQMSASEGVAVLKALKLAMALALPNAPSDVLAVGTYAELGPDVTPATILGSCFAAACNALNGARELSFGVLGFFGSAERDVAPAGEAADRLQRAVCREVLPWADGSGDPLRARVEARHALEAGY